MLFTFFRRAAVEMQQQAVRIAVQALGRVPE